MSIKCSKCGTMLPDDAEFCHKCGAIIEASHEDGDSSSKKSQKGTGKNQKLPIIITSISLAVVLALSAFCVVHVLNKDKSDKADGKNGTAEISEKAEEKDGKDEKGKDEKEKKEDGEKINIENMNFVFLTGGESGTYYSFGSVISQHATNNAGVKITVVSSAGSQENIYKLQDGDADFAFCQSDVMTYAYNGTNLFAGTGKADGFSTVAALYTEQVQIVTCNPEIKSVADLKGKRVSLGDAGSGTYFNAMDILSAYGLTVNDISPVYYSFGDSADAIKNGMIDAAFVVASAPTTAVSDLSAIKQVYIVPIDEEHIDALIQKSPYYSSCTISADTYNMSSDVKTVSIGAVLLARNDVPEEAVYALVKDIFDNAPNLTQDHAKYKEISLEFGASVTSVPYHPGAAEYFAEKGFNVPVG